MSTLPDGRYIDDAPYDPDENLNALEREEMDAPNWVLVWRKFKRHKLGLISGIFLLLSYLMLPFAGFIAPYTPNERHADHLYAPPQGISFFHDGEFIGPHVIPYTARADLQEFRWYYDRHEDQPAKLEFFCRGEKYNLAGFIRTDRHLFCAPEGATVFLWGSDRLGRDVFSRILFGAQLSLTVGLIGITVSFVLGITFGAIAGYYGGRLDWSCPVYVPVSELIYATFRSNAKGLLPPNDEWRRRGL